MSAAAMVKDNKRLILVVLLLLALWKYRPMLMGLIGRRGE